MQHRGRTVGVRTCTDRAGGELQELDACDTARRPGGGTRLAAAAHDHRRAGKHREIGRSRGQSVHAYPEETHDRVLVCAELERSTAVMNRVYSRMHDPPATC